MVASEIEIEVGDDLNSCLFFLPLQRKVRGRFDYLRVREANARKYVDQYPNGIPGQRLRVNVATGEASLIEPLREDAEHQNLARKIEKQHGTAPQSEHFKLGNPDEIATWLFWMQRAVEVGVAKPVRGSFPKSLPGVPKKRFFGSEQPSSEDKMVAAIEAQTAAFTEMTKAITSLVQLVAKK